MVDEHTDALNIKHKALTIVSHIERQSLYIRRQMESIVRYILYNEIEKIPGMSSQSDTPLRMRDIERFYDSWAAAVPDNPPIKKYIGEHLTQEYLLNPLHHTRTAKLLNVEFDPEQTATDREQSSALSLALEDLNLEIVKESLEYVYLESGEVLFREGDDGDSSYIIASGRVQVTVRDGKHERLLAERVRLDTVGDLAILLNEKRSATVTAIRDTELWRIPRETFDQLVHEYPAMSLQLLRRLGEILSATNNQKVAKRKPSIITIVPIGDFDGTGDFAKQLLDNIKPFGIAQLLTSANVNTQVEENTANADRHSIEGLRLTNWLNEQEDFNDFVIYQTDTHLNNWTRRCIRQSDIVLLVGMGHTSNHLNEIEKAIFTTDEFNSAIRKDLIMLHEHDDLPNDTAAYLAKRPVNSHQHIRLNDANHMKRLARITVGESVALVLSGGTIRSFAHIGILRALIESGIPIDTISGTSSGSIVAGQLAMGMTPQEIYEYNKNMFQDAGKFFDLTLPYSSVIAARRINEAFKDMFGDTQIEDLWIQYFCTTADLTAFETRMHTEGLLRRAVRASCSIPDILPPVIMDGHMLVDGGLTNNYPVSLMQRLIGGGTVFLSNIIPDFYPEDDRYQYEDDMLPFWKVFNARINPFSQKIDLPTIFEVNRRSAECSARGIQQDEIQRADYHIRPELGNVGPAESAKIPHLYNKGYEDTMKMIEELDIVNQLKLG